VSTRRIAGGRPDEVKMGGTVHPMKGKPEERLDAEGEVIAVTLDGETLMGLGDMLLQKGY